MNELQSIPNGIRIANQKVIKIRSLNPRAANRTNMSLGQGSIRRQLIIDKDSHVLDMCIVVQRSQREELKALLLLDSSGASSCRHVDPKIPFTSWRYPQNPDIRKRSTATIGCMHKLRQRIDFYLTPKEAGFDIRLRNLDPSIMLACSRHEGKPISKRSFTFPAPWFKFAALRLQCARLPARLPRGQ
jgi:hypothetical protein